MLHTFGQGGWVPSSAQVRQAWEKLFNVPQCVRYGKKDFLIFPSTKTFLQPQKKFGRIRGRKTAWKERRVEGESKIYKSLEKLVFRSITLCIPSVLLQVLCAVLKVCICIALLYFPQGILPKKKTTFVPSTISSSSSKNTFSESSFFKVKQNEVLLLSKIREGTQ